MAAVRDKTVARQRPRAHDGQSTAEVAVFEATEALLREAPLQDLTVAKIIKRAGLSRANFYHYFSSKYEVLVALVVRLLARTYDADGPWQAPPGKARARSMDESMRGTLDMWSEHGSVVCAAIENMYTVPGMATAWRSSVSQFVDALTEQITYERESDAAPDGPPADTVAAMLVCAIERAFYIGNGNLDARLPTPDSVVDAIVAVTFAAIYRGTRPYRRVGEESVGGNLDMAVDSDVAESLGSKGEANATADSILRGLERLLILPGQSLDSVTVEDILQESGASRATFYFYFGNKDDVFVSLFGEVAGGLVDRIGQLLEVDRSEPESIRGAVANWLELDPVSEAVVRNAIHEWPRRSALRESYLWTVARMTDVLQKVIEVDRAAGVAAEGPEAGPLAAVLTWTIERTVSGALAGEEHLTDLPAVVSLLSDLVNATIYGR